MMSIKNEEQWDEVDTKRLNSCMQFELFAGEEEWYVG